ncbi:MAG: hypothetical protein Q9168_004534 [Polycauliona sp. 1 TL-2023]
MLFPLLYVLGSSALLQGVSSGPVLRSDNGTNITHSFGVAGINATYDYVVVGGGTAGLTIASRLAADPSVTVAVVEAGGFYEAAGNTSIVPAYTTLFSGTDPGLSDSNPAVDWDDVTVPQAGANNRRLHYAQGRTFGGGSARNYMIYHRPTIGSAQKWGDEVQDQSYTFANLLPYYEKTINFTGPTQPYPNTTNEQDESVFSPSGGPVHVSSGNYNDPFATRVLPALRAIGQKAINGFQSGKLLGSAYVLATIDSTTGTRSSSESSFLNETTSRTTLKVYKNTLAKRILFSGNTARGVLVGSSGGVLNGTSDYVLSARKEVIVSAGAFRSPQLLMVSGVGPRKMLKDLGIPLIKDLPGVGKNMWDHVFFAITFRVNVPTSSSFGNDPEAAAYALRTYLDSASGPLSAAPATILGWEKLLPSTNVSSVFDFPADWPQIEYLPASAPSGNQSNFQTQDPRDGFNYASILSALVSPLSRGTVSISSDSTADPPVIDPNWLTHPMDVQLAIAAFKRQRQLWDDHLQNLTIGEEYNPGPAVQTDAEILSFIRETLSPVWHAAATCKMGSRSDRMAVVDTDTKVYGVRRLRVVDASAFPFLPPGHPQSTVYALAEKIADRILKGLKHA